MYIDPKFSKIYRGHIKATEKYREKFYNGSFPEENKSVVREYESILKANRRRVASYSFVLRAILINQLITYYYSDFMRKMLTVEVDDSYAKEIDSLISSTRLYSSRSEFLKDSIRKNLVQIANISKELRLIHAETEKLRVKVMKRGGLKSLSSKQRDALAKKYMGENSLL